MIPSLHCLICGAAALEPVAAFGALPRVTSDCKPFEAGGRLFVCRKCGVIQKSPDEIWFEEIRRIYDAYQIYQMSDGAEQLIFTPNGPVPRSQRLTEYLLATTNLPPIGNLIDIGCGNGAALKQFSAALPRWKLNGSELSERALRDLRLLPNFECLYTGPSTEIAGKFDLVSMIHSLEHMSSPVEALNNAVRLLADSGVLFIEVPDAETSPFDLLVADHLVHFTCETLANLAARAGIAASALTNTVLPKEITLVGRRGRAETSPPEPRAGQRIAEATVHWLHEILALGQDLSRAGNFGIFGTSISGMWLYGSLRDRVSFFVDEDPSRVGKHCAGKPIVSPTEVPPGATVYIPLAPSVAAAVAQRFSDKPGRFVPTPAFYFTAAT